MPNSLPLAKLAQACRMVALRMIYEAGSGHLGTSFSSMDAMVAIRSAMKPGDLFISSKNHDGAAQYAVLAVWGLLSADALTTFRKPGGLPGHPTIETPGIVCNTGSLGMGLSKACGFVWAHRLAGDSGRVFVLLGDGEMSEGQNYEAMLFASRHNMSEITAVVDCNGWQQDGEAHLGSGQIGRLFEAAGWATWWYNDPDADELRPLLAKRSDKPHALILRTRKGKGVKFIEDDPVRFHNAKDMTSEEYHKAMEELG